MKSTARVQSAPKVPPPLKPVPVDIFLPCKVVMLPVFVLILPVFVAIFDVLVVVVDAKLALAAPNAPLISAAICSEPLINVFVVVPDSKELNLLETEPLTVLMEAEKSNKFV